MSDFLVVAFAKHTKAQKLWRLFQCICFTYSLTGNCCISMDGKGRALDNIFIERFWRSIKYEEVYLHDYEDVPAAISGIGRYMKFYNVERPHQRLKDQTPEAVYRRGLNQGGSDTP